MKIVKPEVTLWKQGVDIEAHVAKCARVCYAAKAGNSNSNLLDNLTKSQHLSMFRHASYYFIVDRKDDVAMFIIEEYEKCPYINFDYDREVLYVATNGQFILENQNLYNKLYKYIVDEEYFSQTEMGINLIRYTFNVITQISTSRELNRVSPNNIAEQSTRYCNYSRGKFDGECAICQPHWFDLGQQEVVYLKYDCGIAYYKIDNGEYHPYANTVIKFNKYQDNPNRNLMFQRYMVDTYSNCVSYLQQIGWGMEPQDARGELPLDLATECCYTYSIAEWRHILDLRYYGTTGKPHPNAKIIASKIREHLINLGYEFRD